MIVSSRLRFTIAPHCLSLSSSPSVPSLSRAESPAQTLTSRSVPTCTLRLPANGLRSWAVARLYAFTLAVTQTPPGDGAATSAQEAEETRVDFSKQQLRDQ